MLFFCSHTQGQLLELLDAQRVPDEAQGSEASNADEPAKKIAQPGFLSSRLSEVVQEERLQQATAAMSQLNIYLSEPVILLHAELLAYWRANRDHSSTLTTAAGPYLSATCTSVDSEHCIQHPGCSKKQAFSQES